MGGKKRERERERERERSFEKPRNTLTGNITGRNPQIKCPMVTPSRKAMQTPASATSKQGLDKEARAALPRVRTGLNALRAI